MTMFCYQIQIQLNIVEYNLYKTLDYMLQN